MIKKKTPASAVSPVSVAESCTEPPIEIGPRSDRSVEIPGVLGLTISASSAQAEEGGRVLLGSPEQKCGMQLLPAVFSAPVELESGTLPLVTVTLPRLL